MVAHLKNFIVDFIIGAVTSNLLLNCHIKGTITITYFIKQVGNINFLIMVIIVVINIEL